MSLVLQPYPAYQDSGVPWLGQIPAHWPLERAKWLFHKMHRPVWPSDEVVTCFRDGVVTLRRNRRTTGFTESLKEIGYQGVRRGDLVIHAMDAFAGAIGVSDSDGKCSPVYTVCLPKLDLSTHYYAHVVREMSRAHYILILARGIRERSTDFRFETLSDQLLPVPPLPEQAAIVSFLNHFDRRINRLIRAKRRMTLLLNEQKQAIIQQAVTRGLDPNVRLKPSGVEWLGNVPEHWEMRQLKALSKVQSGITLGKQYLGRRLVEFPYLRVANVQDGHLNLSEVKTINVPEDEAAHSLLQSGDVLMTEGGDPDKLGRGCVWEGEVTNCLHQNHVFAVRPLRPQLGPNYFAALLASKYAKDYFLQTAKQTTNLASTNKTTIGRFPVILPPTEEQGTILAVLEKELAQTGQSITNAQREISLLREYRTRLIADVVTGKLDVRGVALPALEEEDQPEEFNLPEVGLVEELEDMEEAANADE